MFSKWLTWWRWLFIIIIFGALFFIPQIHGAVAHIFFTISKPILLAGTHTKENTQSFGGYFQRISALLDENDALQKENQKFRLDILGYQNLRNENASLRKLMGFAKDHGLATFEAKVIGTFFDPRGISLMLDAGSSDQIVNGSLVLAEGNVLVGKIDSVGREVSKAGFIENSDTTLSVFIVSHEASETASTTESTAQKLIEGLYIGKGNDALVNLVPNDAPVKVGDLVITSGLGENTIRGLVVGEIVSARKNESEIFQDIHVKPFVSYKKLQTVFVISPKL